MNWLNFRMPRARVAHRRADRRRLGIRMPCVALARGAAVAPCPGTSLWGGFRRSGRHFHAPNDRIRPETRDAAPSVAPGPRRAPRGHKPRPRNPDGRLEHPGATNHAPETPTAGSSTPGPRTTPQKADDRLEHSGATPTAPGPRSPPRGHFQRPSQGAADRHTLSEPRPHHARRPRTRNEVQGRRTDAVTQSRSRSRRCGRSLRLAERPPASRRRSISWPEIRVSARRSIVSLERSTGSSTSEKS
ncbi:hypothetical protein QE430_000358 [Microbacterium testaceum]|nr:hypothetical protein [Microbacterium testaceum]